MLLQMTWWRESLLMIDINDLTVSYGLELVLDNINLHIESKKTCAIIGPSGCGKTTLLYAVAGLIQPNKGRVLINGEEIRRVRRRTGVIFQDNGLLPWKKLYQNVALGLQTRGFEKAEISYRVHTVLGELGMIEHINKYP